MIAIDAMGGDYAPDAVIQGSLSFVKATSKSVCLFGPQADLEERLNALDASWRDYPLTIVDCPEVVAMDDEPVSAIKKKQNSSLVRAILAAKEGQCDVVVSAGNSGAMLAAGLLLIGRNKGVDRPALVGLFPGKEKAAVCLDLGANSDCKAKNLYQFAHLGVLYAQEMFDIQSPTVALLSNGEEESKGSLITKEAFALLKASSLNFVGNVEPEHIIKNKADVVVCDGFVGNVMLKTFEATVQLCCPEYAKAAHIGKQGGALLIGVQKPVVVVHGNARAGAIEKALGFAQMVAKKTCMEKYCID